MKAKYPNQASEFISLRSYCRWLPEESRRETWEEVTDRVINFLRTETYNADKIPAKVWSSIKKGMLEFNVMPSMRLVATAGPAAKKSNICMYNCAYLPIDSLKSFSEIMYILLCGTGVGFSVETEYTRKLSVIKHQTGNRRDDYTIEDSREGWANAFLFGLETWYNGEDVIFKYDQIRPYGAPLLTMGGRASGSDPLKELLVFTKEIILNAVGRKLKTIECYDIACKSAEVVVAGGTRRSSCISFSDIDDLDMAMAKRGNYPIHRRMSNNSVVFKEKPDTITFLREWSNLAESGTGERGILNISNLSKITSTREFTSEMRTNPCITGDTWILTSTGAKQVNDLIGSSFNAYSNGEMYKSDKGFWYTGDKDVFKIKTKRGYELKLTKNHKLGKALDSDGTCPEWIELKDINIGDTICLSNHTNCIGWNNCIEDEKKGWLLGILVGDGTFSQYAHLDFWGIDGEKMASLAQEYMNDIFNLKQYIPKKELNKQNKIRLTSAIFTKFAAEFNITKGNKKITDKIEYQSSSFYCGFLRGLFDADGSVQGDMVKGVSIRLSQSDIELLKRVQRMLLRLGILSTIYEERKEAGNRLLPDGKGGYKEYYCKTNHELVISNQSIYTYKEIIGFNDNSKQTKLIGILLSYKRNMNKNVFADKIISIEYVGKEKVYDTNINSVHEFCANGIRAHNCGEILLKPFQFCNLSEAVVRSSDDISDLVDKVKTATWAGIIQSTFTYFPNIRDKWRKNCEEERLIGVSLTGQLDNPEILTDEVLNQLKKVVVKTASHAAKILGINEPKAFTTSKPSGTVSQVVNSSSGCHPRFSKYYIRRYRISKSDPLFLLLKDQGVPWNPEVGQKRDNATTMVVEFPVKSPSSCIIKDDWDAMNQLNWYMRLQKNWSTHNVSNTVYVKKNQWLKVGNWVYENFDDIVGIAFLPNSDHNYKLAPYEEITEEIFNELNNKFPTIDFSKLGEYEKETGDKTEAAKELACSGGLCEIS